MQKKGNYEDNKKDKCKIVCIIYRYRNEIGKQKQRRNGACQSHGEERPARQLIDIQHLRNYQLEHELKRLIKFELRHISDVLPEIFVQRSDKTLLSRMAYHKSLLIVACNTGRQAELVAGYTRHIA